MARSFRNPKIYVTTPEPTPYDKLQKRKRIAAGIFVGIFTLGIFWLLFFSPVFAISDILVEGDLPADVHSRFDEFKGHNIFRLDPNRLERELIAEFPHIRRMVIYRGLPNALKIEIQNRQAKLYWETNSIRYVVDEEGVPFKEVVNIPTSVIDLPQEIFDTQSTPSEQSLDLPVVVDSHGLPLTLGIPIVTADFVRFVDDLKRDFYSVAGIGVLEFRVGETTFQIEAVTDQGYSVFFDTERRADRQLAALRKLLDGYKEKVSEYIDLRVAGKAYVK